MGDPLTLSLRAWPKEDPQAKSLSRLIPRINDQRGNFRNITEEGLQEEIRVLQAGGDSAQPDTDEAGGVDAKDDDASVRKEEVMAAREEIVKQIGQAHMETYYALDFVSLLLSRETPRQAEVSMSELLRKRVPLGSLGAERVQATPASEVHDQDDELVSRGWKLQGLNSAADSLLRSATRLEKEIEQETRYWEQVLAVSERGWSVCRLPREKHTLGVRFGFSEAVAEFRERGLAALRRGPDGSVTLDQGLLDSTPKTIRVRIQDTAHDTIGTSTVPTITPEDSLVESPLFQARNTIYDEELYYEMTREARLLANVGVRTLDSSISLTLLNRQILIDLIPLPSTASSPTPPNSLAESICLALRLLLSHSHHQNLRRRSQPLPPLSDRKRTLPPYPLLRPLLTTLLHTNAITSLTSFLTTLTAPLTTASLPSSISLSAFTNTALPPSTNPFSILETFTSPATSTITLTLPSLPLTLALRTQLAPPHLGTSYHLTHLSHTHPPAHFSSPTDLTTHLTHLTTQSLTSLILSWTPAHLEGKDVDPDTPGEVGWTRSGGSGPEMVRTFRKTGRAKRLVIGVGEGRVEVRWSWVGGERSQGVGKRKKTQAEAGRCVWTGGEEGEKRPFREVVSEAGRYGVD
ncbi:MAG: RNA polymerase II mediator complex subunit [Piccolia ochrophora]|nr:MAG: RNA polymerase II mediator complex subunit [Piccolia ochrophora]